MLKKFVQQGRSERRPEAYPQGYVEGLNEARTLLAGFFSILLEEVVTENQVRTAKGKTQAGGVAAATAGIGLDEVLANDIDKLFRIGGMRKSP